MDFTICFQCYPTNHSSKHILLSIGLWLMNFVSIYPCQSNFVSLQRHLSNPLFKCIPPLTGWWFVKFFEINLPLKGKLYFESHIESWMVSKLQYMMTWIGNCIFFSLHQKKHVNVVKFLDEKWAKNFDVMKFPNSLLGSEVCWRLVVSSIKMLYGWMLTSRRF